MPQANGPGYSESTKEKQELFLEILKQLTSVVKNRVWPKGWANEEYWYIDINAGPGTYQDCDGSPIVFVNWAKSFGLTHKAHFIEWDQDCLRSLKLCLSNHNSYRIWPKDHKEALPEIMCSIPHNTYGMLYTDPNGTTDFDLLAKFSQWPTSHYIDIVIRYNAAATKRNLHQGKQRMLDGLATINKEYWIIQEPRTSWQRSFLIGLNWDGLRTMKHLGFHYLHSKHGKEIANTLHYTKKEMQPRLF